MHLTEREIHILTLLARGLSTKHIARELELSWHTVRDHRRAILRKFGVSNMVAAVSRWKDMVCA